MRDVRRIAWFLLPVAALLVASLALHGPESAQTVTPTSDCLMGAQMSADPMSLVLGDTSLVTTVVTQTCPAYQLPMDLVFLVDISNSMNKSVATVPPRGTNPSRSSPTPVPPRDLPTSPPGREPPTGIPPRETPGGPRATPTAEVTEPAGEEDLLKEVRSAIYDFLKEDDVQASLKSGKLHISLVTFNTRGKIDVPLTDNDSTVRSRLARLKAGGDTNVNIGLQMAETALRGRSRTGVTDNDRVKVVALYSDGEFPERTLRGSRSRDAIKVVTLAAGRQPNLANMRKLATEREYALTLRDRKEFMTLFRKTLPAGRPVSMDPLTLRLQMSDNMALIPGSAAPVPSVISGTLPVGALGEPGRLLVWELPAPAGRLTLTYQVRPLDPGLFPVLVSGAATWTDSEKRTGTFFLPNVDLEALAPTETPTATATPTDTPTPTATWTPSATPTPTPGPRYLPVVESFRPLPTATARPCVPSEQTVDVVLVVDTSNSMLEPTSPGGPRKIDAAIDAGITFLDNLKLPAGGGLDQVAVVWFNGTSGLEAPLSGDKAAVTSALRRLTQRQAADTRIDLGLETAHNEITGPRHRSQNNQAVVLVTDGRQDPAGGPTAVTDQADRIKRAGVTLWTVGLGIDVDEDLLRQAATSPAYFKLAPDARDLRFIYEEIARVVPCGG